MIMMDHDEPSFRPLGVWAKRRMVVGSIIRSIDQFRRQIKAVAKAQECHFFTFNFYFYFSFLFLILGFNFNF